jgi:hypothetical protein
MANELPYTLGTRFWVPLRDGGFARGLVARMNERGVIFAYFFPPNVASPGDWNRAGPISVENCTLRAQVGDLGLTNGEWKIDSQLPNWTAEAWPMPPFVRRDSSGQFLISTYDDQIQFQSERGGTPSDLEKFPKDVLMGYGSAEIKLTKLLAGL